MMVYNEHYVFGYDDNDYKNQLCQSIGDDKLFARLFRQNFTNSSKNLRTSTFVFPLSYTEV